MYNLQLVPVSEGLIEYCFYKRIFKDRYDVDEKYFTKLWLDNAQYMRAIIIDDNIIGIAGFIPDDEGLLGYLVLTTSYKKYAKYVLRKMLDILNKFKCKVKFINHNDDNTIHKWYKLLGFRLVNNYWIREASI